MSWLRNIWRGGPPKGRRNTITRDDLPALTAAGAVAAIAATFAGCQPTGNLVGDAIATGGITFFVAWLAGTASWWSLVVAGGITAAIGGGWMPLLCGLGGAAIGLWLGDQRVSMPWLRATSAGLTVQGLLRLDIDLFFSASALAAGATMVFIGGVGLQRRRRYARRRIIRSTLIALGIGVLFAAGFGISAAGARDDIEVGYQGLLDGLNALQAGDPVAARAALRDAARHLAAADDDVDALWAQPSRLVPVVAQHQQVLGAVLGQAATSATAAADALDLVDFDQLTIVDGRIDIDAVAILERPLTDLAAAVTDLYEALRDADSPWLLDSVAQRLDRYLQRADDTRRQAATIREAAAVGPSLLGSDGPRRYFVGFATPAEARGLVGVMGNYAILTIDDGLITRTDFGRINDVRNRLADAGPVQLDASAEFRDRYATYGLGDGVQPADTADDPTNPSFWSNVTMTPDMPTAAALIGQLWELSGGDPVDGVIIVDPTAIAGLLQATGPITVDGLDTPLTATTVQPFLLLDQYALDTPERRDLLEAVADATLDALLGGALPPPQRLAQALGPAATDGHLLMWSRRPSEQALLRLIGVDGTLPQLAGRDGIAVVSNNGTANKIDSFLRRDIEYRAEHDPTSGYTSATLTITLTNTAPSSGYPDYVIGSEFLDLPLGTNRTLLSVYTALNVVDIRLDGQVVDRTTDSEQGWNVSTIGLDLAPGQERVVVITLDGVIDAPDDRYELVVRPQPMAADDSIQAEVVSADGDGQSGAVLVRYAGTLTRRAVLVGSTATPVR